VTTQEERDSLRGNRAFMVLEHMIYMTCPRGSGDFEDHKRKYLTHRVWRDRLVCITEEMAKDFDAYR
jgi:hypothetical protein